MKKFILTLLNHILAILFMGVGVYFTSDHIDYELSYIDSVMVSNGIMMCVYAVGLNRSIDKYIK